MFTGTATDVDIDNSILEVEWLSSVDGSLGFSTVDSTGNVTFSYANLSPSPHNITMLVTDDAGATCSSNIVLEVAGGPEISIAFPNDGAVVNEKYLYTLRLPFWMIPPISRFGCHIIVFH